MSCFQAEFERRRPHHDLGHIVGSLNSEDVDSAAETFPLCMSHLHRQLRLKHRLRHEERVRTQALAITHIILILPSNILLIITHIDFSYYDQIFS